MSAEKVVSVEDDIAAAMEEIANKEEVVEEPIDDVASVEPTDTETKPEKARAEDGKFTKEKAKEAKEVQAPTVEKSQAPQSWSPAAKAEFDKLPALVQAEVNKREKDMHQAMTRNDGELSLGRELKEVITPYMPIIQAEGGTPAKAVQSLLNTAYILRTGTAEQKANAVHQIAQTYGVDLGIQQTQQNPLDPFQQQILSRIDGIENKFTQQMTLQEKADHDRIMSERDAFIADPKNIYFEQVRGKMASLLGTGEAKDLEQAYTDACWAHPEIRPILIQQQQVEEQEKRRSEVAKKKGAGSSVTGSPGVNTSSSTPNQNTVEDDVRKAMDDLLN